MRLGTTNTNPHSKRRPLPLFSPQGKAQLQRLGVKPENTLLAFDLDGTLTPIIRDFRKARLGKEISQALSVLAEEFPVTIISGRSVGDLRRLVEIKKVKLVGNHGLEGTQDPQVRARAEKARSFIRIWEKVLRKEIQNFPGVFLENKKFSLTIHYRLAQNKRRVRAKILEVVRQLPGPIRIILGKAVFNLLPDLGTDKGSALLYLMKQLGCSHGIFIGDDITDEDAFRLRQKNILTIRVGYSANTHARYFVRSQNDVLKILKILAQLSQN